MADFWFLETNAVVTSSSSSSSNSGSTTAVQQQYNSSTYRPIHNGSTAVPQELGGICAFLRFSTFRGTAGAVPRRDFSCPPLAELGLLGRWVAGDTEGWCVGRAWHGRAIARGRVASCRAESCKCTVLRVGRIAPLARERSHVILVGHMDSCGHECMHLAAFSPTNTTEKEYQYHREPRTRITKA